MLLKTIPEDFIVQEISLFEDTPGSYTYAKIIKCGLTTEQALMRLAKKFGARTRFHYAGAKDRNAITVQYCSFKGKLTPYCDEQLALYPVAHGKTPLSLGSNVGNNFIITIRKLENSSLLPSSFSFVNKFGSQRFGQHNVTLGKYLLTRHFLDAAQLLATDRSSHGLKVQQHLQEHPADAIGALQFVPFTLLLLFIHAFQSKLWNIMAERSELKELPLIGFGTQPTPLVIEVLKQEGVTFRDFIIPQFPKLTCEGSMRSRIVSVNNLTYTFAEDEFHRGYKKAVVSFSLPKGSYATQAVSSLFSKD